MNIASASSLNIRDSDLFHIILTPSLTYCLICMEDIACFNLASINTGQDQTALRSHLESRNHKDNICFFFKLCVPRLFEDVKEDTCVNVVYNSVLDASKALGKEKCYVALKKSYWRCLLCKFKVANMNCTGEALKKQVNSHIMSDTHLAAIREFHFLYKYGDSGNYLRFYKATVYCSYCDETHLIKTTDNHFHSFKPHSARSEW